MSYPVSTFFLVLWLLSWSQAGAAQPAGARAVLTLQDLPASGLMLNKGWVFHAGDDPAWAQPGADDRQWQPLDPARSVHQLPEVQQAGVGWLRLRFRVGPALQHRALALRIYQSAASEVYLNGRLLRRYGTVSAAASKVQAYWPDGEPLELRTDTPAEQVLAVRIAHWPPVLAVNRFFAPAFFEARVESLPQLVRNLHNEAAYKTADMLLFGAFLLIGFLHLSFFLYNSAQRANSYFALYTLLAACSFGLAGFMDEIRRLDVRLAADVLSYVCLQTGSLLAVRALYCLFNVRVGPVYYGLWVANVVSLGLLTFTQRLQWYPTVLFMVLVTAEELRLTLGALHRTKRAAGIIATGFGIALALLLVFGYVATLRPGLMRVEILSIPVHTLLTFPAFLSPVLAISLFLTRRFALDSRLLTIKLEQVRRLSTKTQAQQQEKQELLARQNETLEQLVQKRTAALQQTLNNLQATQHQLLQREKMASLGELTAGIAHEIQNPLNFINNFADVAVELLTELRDGPLQTLAAPAKTDAEALVGELTQDLEKITYHGHRADSIVKSMLEHSRANPGEQHPTNLNTLADEFLRLAYHGLRAKDKSFNATLTTDFDPTLVPVEMVAQDIGRVLLNLFNNAFYAVQQRQNLGQPGYRPEVCVSTKRAPDGQVLVQVKDNGMGMPEAVREKIFQPFFTTKPTGEGTGLGLSLSYDIVTKGHGGTISVDTKPGDYTAFTVSLPVSHEKLQALTYTV